MMFEKTEKVDLRSWIETQRYLQQILNEVLHGLCVDYEAQLHAPREHIAVLSRKVERISAEEMLSPEDTRLLLRISHLCEEEIGDREFFTRVGYTTAEAHVIVARLEKTAAQTAPETTHATAS